MIKKIFWSSFVLALVAAGLIYVVAHHQGKDPITFTQEQATKYSHIVEKQLKGVDWDELKGQLNKKDLQDELAPQPLESEGGEFVFPNDVIAESPDVIPTHIDIEGQAISTFDPNDQISIPSPEIPTVFPEFNETKPSVMPYCEEDKPTQRMPYADEKTSSSVHPIGTLGMIMAYASGAFDSVPSQNPFEMSTNDFHALSLLSFSASPDEMDERKPPRPVPTRMEKVDPTVEEMNQEWNRQLKGRYQSINQQHRLLQLEQELLPKRLDVDTMEARPGDVNWWSSFRPEL